MSLQRRWKFIASGFDLVVVTDDSEERFIASCNPYRDSRVMQEEDIQNASEIVELHNNRLIVGKSTQSWV